MNYSEHTFTSPCCNAFYYYEGNNIICTNCLNKVKTLTPEEELTISITYNVNDNDTSHMSNDLLQDQIHKLARCSNDITLELTPVKCPKCQHYSRIARDLNGVKIFVCSNKDCRNRFKL